MKNLLFIHILLFVLMLLMYQCAGAQDLLVTTKGDTLFGETRQISFAAEKKVMIVDNEKKKSTFSIFQIRSFTSRNETFIPVRTNNGYTFMKVIKAGYLSLLKFQLENQMTYDGQYLLKNDGQGIEVPNLAFKKILSNFLSDCPVISRRVSEGEFGKNQLPEIVDQYNACIQSNSEIQVQAGIEKKVVDQKINAWDVLQAKVEAKTDFQSKQDALDMIRDIKSKIARKEKVPNFIVEGLKSSLANAEVNAELDAALKELRD